MDATFSQTAALSNRERYLLVLPLLGSAFVGLFLLLAPTLLAALTGYSGNDLYVYRLCGAATIGYPIALGLGLRQNNWSSLRLVVLAFFVFGLGSLYACFAEIITGNAHPVVYVVLALTLIFATITGSTLALRQTPKAIPDIAAWVVGLLIVATLLAAIFGLLPLFLPSLFGHTMGLKATDIFIYRQTGAATLGYAVMGIFELRSRNWQEIRWPVVMGMVFNAVSFLSSLLAFITRDLSILLYLTCPVTLAITAALLLALRRNGQ